MAIVEAGDDFGIDDHKIINDEIGNEGADVLAVVANDVFPLHIASQTLLGEFDDKGAFVELLIKAGFEGE
jgi:hypothetical protein